MVRVEHLMTTQVMSIEPTECVSIAAQLMRLRGIGSLLVTRNQNVVGIVTESDIVKKVVAVHLNPDFIPVELIMSTQLVTIDESGSIFEAAGMMQAARTRHLLVGQIPQVVGILSVRDVLAPVAKDEL